MISSIIIGTATGLISSFLIWFAFSRLVRPKIEISKSISKTSSLVAKNPMFRLKIENLSWNKAYDISLTGRIKIYGLREALPEKPSFYIARIGDGSHPYIESKLANKSLEITGREFLVRPTKEAKDQLSQLWEINASQVNIETILQKDERNILDVSVIAVHGFSGARKTFVQKYQHKDIKPHCFALKGTTLTTDVSSYIAAEDDIIDD